MTDHFASDGKTLPFHGWTYPNAMHADGVTYFAYEGEVGSSRAAKLCRYDHTAGLWLPDVVVGPHSLANDGHGTPALVKDATGTLRCFFGGHNSTVYERVSTDGGATWTTGKTFAGAYTYPHPVVVGSSLYLIMRRKTATSMGLVLFQHDGTQWVTGPNVNGELATILNWGSGTRTYAGAAFELDGAIHLALTRTPYSGTTTARDVWHGVLHVSTHQMTTPLLVDQTTRETSYPSFSRDASGNLYLAYLDGNAGNFAVMARRKPYGQPWGSPELVAFLNQSPDTYVCALPDGSAVYPEDEAGQWTRGGNIVRRERTPCGCWGEPVTLLGASGYALEQPTPVFNAHPDARLVFCEIAPNDSDSSGGDLKLYAWGDAGFLTRSGCGCP